MTTITERPLISSYYDRALIEDDTEESVSGSDWHLQAILAFYDALLRHKVQGGFAWYVTAEVLILADLEERTDNPWRSMPDVYVAVDGPHRQRVSYDTRDGLPYPQFVCEVVSKDTWRKDVAEKQRVYADTGVLEYIVFDPTQEFLRQPLRAWRQTDAGWVRWLPDADGFLVSAVLGLRFRAEDVLLRVYNSAGRVPTSGELAEIAEQQEAAIAEQGATLAEQGATLAEQGAAIAEQGATLAERDAALAERDAALAERDAALVEKDATLAERDAALAEERARNASLLAEVERLRGDVRPPEV